MESSRQLYTYLQPCKKTQAGVSNFVHKPTFWSISRSVASSFAFVSWFYLLQALPMSTAKLDLRCSHLGLYFLAGFFVFQENPPMRRVIAGLLMLSLYTILISKNFLFFSLSPSTLLV